MVSYFFSISELVAEVFCHGSRQASSLVYVTICNMLGRDYYHKIASNFDPQGMAVPKRSCNSTIFITAKCKQISSNQQPTRTFQLCIVRREDVEREIKQGKFGLPGITSCTALR